MALLDELILTRREILAVEVLAGQIPRSHARWMPRVVKAIFGTNDSLPVAEGSRTGVTLGVSVVAARFSAPGVRVVVGLGPRTCRQGALRVVHAAHRRCVIFGVLEVPPTDRH
jgi:hypothetical protein